MIAVNGHDHLVTNKLAPDRTLDNETVLAVVFPDIAFPVDPAIRTIMLLNDPALPARTAIPLIIGLLARLRTHHAAFGIG